MTDFKFLFGTAVRVVNSKSFYFGAIGTIIDWEPDPNGRFSRYHVLLSHGVKVFLTESSLDVYHE